jgi:membrane associated rhomboid family serine protease
VTVGLAATIVAVYGVERAGDGLAICEAHGLVPSHPTVGSALTSLFLHDPATWQHVGVNLVVLAVFGSIVERTVGALRFLVLYVAAGLCGAALHVLVDPTATQPLVGASGSISGALALAAVLRPRLLGFVATFASLNIGYAFTGTGGSISFGSHLGGFFVGAVAAWLLQPPISLLAWRRA